jgi:hypothetical protein
MPLSSLATLGSTNRRTVEQSRHEVIPYLRNNQNKKDWWDGSSGSAMAWHTRGPEFNSQYCKKKKKLSVLFKAKPRQ